MADAQYVIDLILRAHDQSAQAFASLLGNQKALEDQTKQTQEQIERSNRALEDSNKRLAGTIKDLQDVEDLDILKKKEVAAATVELEKAARNYARVNQDATATDAQRVKGLTDMQSAYKGLTTALKEKTDLDQRERQNVAERIRSTNLEIGRIEEQRKKLEQLAATERQVSQERDRLRSQQLEADRRAGQERQRIARATEAEQARLVQQLRQQAQALSREDVGAAKYDELSRSIARTRQELGRLTGDSRSALREQKAALDAAGVSIDRNSRAYVNQREAIRENTRAIDAYEKAVNRAAKAQVDLSKSTGAQKVRFEFEVDQRKQAALFAAKQLAAKDVEVNVDVDIGAAVAKLATVSAGLQATSRSGRGVIGTLGLISASFRDNFANMEGSVARFDNVMRGAFTLLVTFFLPQLIILAGAAGGAILALGSSALFAGGAIGGAFVSGIAQAIPALGVFATALSRVKGVMDAVQQANLLHEQQSYQGAQQSRSRANAENTLTNALEQQKAAQENIAEAQERVTEARRAAIRETEDLILAERRASLSVEEAENALRDAIQAGRGAEIESRRLDLQEAQLRAQRATEDARQARATGDPGGRIEDAQESLRDAEVAAGRAQRAVENARRSSEGAAVGVTAAAGKLQYLKEQMSDAELALFRALTALQNRFRDFARNVSEPIIESFTRTTRRITELLGDRRIVSAARGISQAMAKEFDAATDTFTRGKPLQQQLTLAKEAARNMELFGRATRAAGRIFLDVAVAAAPAFRQIGEMIAGAAERLQEFTGSQRGQREMREFFRDGVTHLRAWIGLLGSIVRLFASIAGAGGGARTGLELVRGMTESINEFAESVNSKGSDAQKFFKDLFTVTKLVGEALGPILKSLAQELGNIFGEEAGSGGAAIKGFTNITTQLLIPMLGQFLRIMIAIGNAVGTFVDEHPGIARIAVVFGSIALTVGVLGKAFALLFGPLRSLIGTVLALRTAFSLTFRALLVGGLIAGAVAGVVLLLHKFGELDDIWRAIQRGVRSLAPAFNRLVATFKDLGKELGITSEGSENFLRVMARIIRIGIVAFFRGLFRVIEMLIDVFAGLVRIVTGVIRVVKGLADVVIGFFTLDEDQMLKGFKGIASGLGKIFEGILGVVKGIISAIGDAFAGLPGLLLDIGKEVAKQFAKGISGLPRAVYEALKAIGTGAISLAKVLARLIDDALPDKISLPGLPDVNLPDNPLKDIGAYATGGAIPGYGGGDRVAALLEPGEHVWTKEEVSSAGGHGMMYALRSFFGRGGQATGRGYAEGGQVRDSGARNAQEIAALDLGDLIKIIDAAGGRIMSIWRGMWSRVNNLSQEGRQALIRVFRQIANTVDERMQDAAQAGRRRAQQLKNNVLNHVEQMDRGVERGIRYVARQVNTALDTFGARPARISIDTPPNLARAATGGWIGSQGERGYDAVPTLLGRGEAVLNWGHQKIVNSALWNTYGTTLDSMFKQTKGYHAGGQEQPGMAAGGPMGAGPGFNPIARFLSRRFGIGVTSGLRNTTVAGTNSPSLHNFGQAIDASNAQHPTPQMDAAAKILAKRLGNAIFKPGVTSGFPALDELLYRTNIGGNHFNHIHIGLFREYAFNAKKVARLMRGLDYNIKRIIVKGTGSLQRFTQRALDKVRNAANNFVDEKMAEHGGFMTGVGDPHPGKGVATRAQMERWAAEALTRTGHQPTREAIEKILTLAAKESSWVVDSINLWDSNAAAGNPSGGLMHVTIDKVGGSKAALFDPIINMMASIRYQYDRYGGLVTFSPYGKGGEIAKMPQFATGGVIGGESEGEPTPILAHAGEWVLNRRQQSKLLGLLGTTSGRLKQFLGFSGRAISSFQEGGEIASAGFSTPAERRASIREGIFLFPPFPLRTFNEIRQAFNGAIRALRNAGTRIKEDIEVRTERYLRSLRAVTGEGGLLDILSERIERHTQQMATNLTRSQFRLIRGPRGRIRDVFRRQADSVSDEEIADQAIRNQIRTLNELNSYRRRVIRILNSVKRQEDRLQARIKELRRGGIDEDEQKEFDRLNERRQQLRTERIGLQDRLQEIKDAIAEQIQAIYEARTEQIRNLADNAGRPTEFAALWERVAGAIGGSMTGAIQGRIAAMQQQASGLQTAINQARKIGNQELVRELEMELADVNVSLFESQMELVRQVAQEAIEASERRVSQANLRVRIAEAMGQNSLAAQQGVIDQLRNQLQVIQQQIDAARRANNQGLLQELLDSYGETQATIIEAQQQLMRDTAQRIMDQASRPTNLAQIQLRIAQVLGTSTLGIQQTIINSIQGQIAATNTAIQLATNAGNVAFADELRLQLAELQATLVEAQQALVQAQIDEIRRASNQQASAAQRGLRIQQLLGQSTALAQLAIIQAIQAQVAAVQEAIQVATAAGNVGLRTQLEEELKDLQVAVLEAQQTLFENAINQVNEAARRAQVETGIRQRLADLMERGGNAIGAAQVREQILAAQRVNISQLLESFQTLLDQQLTLPATQQNQNFIQQLTEQVQELGTQLEENTLALQDSANATRDAMIAAINQPAQFQTGVFNQLNNILQSLSNLTNTSTINEQGDMLTQIGQVLSGQGTQLRQQLLNWLGVNLLGLSGTEFVTAIAGLDWQTLTLGMSQAEKTTFENLIQAIIENQLQVQQNTEALQNLSNTFNPQDFTSVAWTWFRTAIFSGSGGLLPQFQPPGLQEGGTVLRTGMALVHEGEWFINPGSGTVPSGVGESLHVEINQAGEPLDVEYLVSRLDWERRGRRR